MPEQIFNYTGANQTFVVPSWVSSINVEVAGAAGQNSIFNIGGRGGLVVGTLPVTPGETLTIVVGGQGPGEPGGGGAAGTPGGGGASNDTAAAGGGCSTIYSGGLVFATNARVVGGGGGGAGGTNPTLSNPPGGNGGHGGTSIGGTGQTGGGQGGTPGRPGGSGGTQFAGGAYGEGNIPAPTIPDNSGVAGASHFGGRGGNGMTGAGWINGLGGGGGGGWFGGGGGGTNSGVGSLGGGGGGGGSNFVHSSMTNVAETQGARTGKGYVKISWGSPQENAPTNVTPSSGSVVNTNLPTLGATVVASGAAKQRVEWHLATTPDFVTNFRVIAEPTSDLRVSGATTEAVPSAQKLFQGTWYLRARTLDEGGVPSPWSPTQQFVVQHIPAAIPTTPSSGQTVAYSTLGIAVGWQFSDPSPDDVQSAYQVIVEDANLGTSVADTGKVNSVAKSAQVLIPESKKNSVLRWKVRVWDSDNVASSYSSPLTFIVADAPGIAVSAMTTVSVPNPLIAFTFTPVVAPLSQYRVTIRKVSDNSQVFDSGWVRT